MPVPYLPWPPWVMRHKIEPVVIEEAKVSRVAILHRDIDYVFANKNRLCIRALRGYCLRPFRSGVDLKGRWSHFSLDSNVRWNTSRAFSLKYP